MIWNPKKTIEMLHYTDDDGNTVIHHMAKRHDKFLLYHIITRFSDKLIIESNWEAKSPKQLYNESKLENILGQCG